MNGILKNALILMVMLALPWAVQAQTLSGQAPHVPGQEIDERVGIEEHLDTTIPLADLKFTDEDGNPVVLGDLFGKPVILTLVYFFLPRGKTVAGSIFFVQLGVAFYGYEPIVSDLRNPPMNWGYPR